MDRERQRISLSIKQLAEDPWARAVRELRLGETVQATITRVMPYGAFARIGPGIEGLVHVSEIADHRIATPDEVVHLGDAVRVRLVSIDPERRRISLSIRQAERV
ncbi:MAG: S1 RNA-binding domain-containing protein [Chloroflexi bacterium]|nr:MAG: S1 RNA-binding domain-containing protein [Chloroflexota bacterium]